MGDYISHIVMAYILACLCVCVSECINMMLCGSAVHDEPILINFVQCVCLSVCVCRSLCVCVVVSCIK